MNVSPSLEGIQANSHAIDTTFAVVTIHCAHTALVDPATLQPNPANPNRHGAGQIQLLAAIIRDQGWRAPITVSNRSGMMVRGHGRLEAALLLWPTWKTHIRFETYKSQERTAIDAPRRQPVSLDA